MLKQVFVPDIGDYKNVDVIEILVVPGDTVECDAPLITLETDKATLEVPAPFAGTVHSIEVKLGDKVSKGSLIITLETAEEEVRTSLPKAVEANQQQNHAAVENTATVQKVLVPDIGAYQNVDVIDVSVVPGDKIEHDATLITLETDKATLDVPAPFAGVVQEVHVKVGDKVSEGSLVVTVLAVKAEPVIERKSAVPAPQAAAQKTIPEAKSRTQPEMPEKVPYSSASVHAGPGVRRFARELGVDLSRVKGTGHKQRILKIDVQWYVKAELSRIQSGDTQTGGMSVAPWPQVDFAQFGEIERESLSRIKKLSGSYLHRNWVMVPHVTQFDDADMTDLEAFRKGQQAAAEQQGLKLTPLVFLLQAVVEVLKEFPHFNASLDPSGSELILKKYYHIGVAVDTPNGLVVPVVRDVDQKGIFQLAKELGEISAKAREGQLKAQEMQGSSFSISSLGGIGGTAFTPIINVPDVAILGVSKAQMKPIYEAGEFKPRLRLPLSLSYDHRVIDGAQGARFITRLVKQLSDIECVKL